MAFRSWLKLLAATVTAAVVVGAGQLGIAYGLGMVRLDQTLEITQRDQWTAQLAWIAWMTMTAAALGAVVATGLRPRWSPRPIPAGGALAMGLAAGIGALAILPLTMQPARDAQVAGVQPVLVIGICAGLGAAIGIFAAYAAAARAVARWSIATVSVLVWAIALTSVVPSLKSGGTPTPARLGVLEGSLIPAAVTEYTLFATMPAIALLTGLIIGWIARGRRMSTTAVALSGLAGPALLTLAYLIAGPGSSAGFELSPYWAAMTASGAGVLGSVLAAIVRSAPETSPGTEPDAPASTPPDAAPEPEPPAGTKPEPASGRAGLPRRDVPNQSAIAQAAAAAALRPEDQLRPSDTGIFSLGGDRPHPLRDLAASSATPAASSPFSSGSGNPFHQGGPTSAHPQVQPGGHPQAQPGGRPQAQPGGGYPQSSGGQHHSPGGQQHSSGGHAQASAAGHRTPTGAHATIPGQRTPTGAHAQVPAPQSAAQFAAPPSIPAQVAGLAPAQVDGPDTEPRFSGQQPAKGSGGLRRGWRTRRGSPEPEQSAALTGDTGSFNGFGANQPAPRTGLDTAEHPRTPEPTVVSAPPPHPQPVGPPPSAPTPRNSRRGREDDYVGWVNGLGGQ
ncbi:hypothetical protein [Actinoplanes sp. G11-F43]|uniref:hypothetical protein n=1 Tax=Actinoplanes sp. G11-F43 TaxID=3424130 RepID=UPI003D329778